MRPTVFAVFSSGLQSVALRFITYGRLLAYPLSREVAVDALQ